VPTQIREKRKPGPPRRSDGILRDSQGRRLVWITCEGCGNRALVRADSQRRFCSRSCAKTREHHPAWKGEDAGYRSLHARVERVRGKADHCERCGLTDPAARYEWANLTGNYADINDYASMCKRCHVRYDGLVGAVPWARKLTMGSAAEIRSRHAAGETRRDLAAEFGVSITAIGNVVRGETWKEAYG